MKKKLNKKQLTLLISLMIVLVFAVGGTLAYIVTQTSAVTNTFKPSEVTCEINDTMNEAKTEKTEAYVTNTGDVDAYIRAVLVFTLRDSEGNISSTPIDATACDLEIGDGWVHDDDTDFYYYTSVVKTTGTEAKTNDLIVSCKLNDKFQVPAGYGLCVEIVADAIQADGVASDGTKPVVKAWGVDPSELQ